MFLVLEYARPPVLPQLKLQLLIALILPVLWLRSQREWSPILTSQLAFLGWCAKSVPFAYNNYAAYLVLRGMYSHVAIAIALSWIGGSLPAFKRVIWIWFSIIIYQALWSIANGGRGLGGFMGDENDLALASVTALPLPVLAFESLTGRARWICAACVVVLVAAVVVSFSRGGFVGLVAVGAYCLVVSRKRLRMMVIAALGLGIVLATAPASYIEEIRSIQRTDEGTARGRMFLWTAAVNMWKANPIFGWGGGNTSFLVGQYQPEGWDGAEYRERDWSGTTVHSLYFQILPEQGLVGFAFFVAAGIYQLRTVRRLRRYVRGRGALIGRPLKRDIDLYSRALNGMLTGYLVTGAFISVAYYPYYWYITALSVALDISVRRELVSPEHPTSRA